MPLPRTPRGPDPVVLSLALAVLAVGVALVALGAQRPSGPLAALGAVHVLLGAVALGVALSRAR